MSILRTTSPVRSKPRKPISPTGRWIVRPLPDADRPGCYRGIIQIGCDLYDLTHTFAWAEGDATADAEGDTLVLARWSVFDFRKRDVADHHVCLTIGLDGEQCSCAWSEMRSGGKPCRHKMAIQAGLAQRDAAEPTGNTGLAVELAEARVELALAALDAAVADAPF